MRAARRRATAGPCWPAGSLRQPCFACKIKDHGLRHQGSWITACDIALVALTLEDIATDAAPSAIRITKGAVSVVRLVALRFSSPKRH
jgi:hypothetical protein